MTQKTFSDYEWEIKGKRTRREKFLLEMEEVIPWEKFEELIAPVAPKEVPGEPGGRPAYAVSVMLRIYFCQSWYSLSDEGVEDALYDSESLRRFCLGARPRREVPDETSIRRFRHLLEKHQLQKVLFKHLTRLLSERGIVSKEGTIVDATLIHAPSSTKNQTKTRDPEMTQTKKGNQWYFGMKCHIGVDEKSGVVHTVIPSTARDADIKYLPALLHGEEKVVRGDSAYCSEPDREELAEQEVTLLTPQKKKQGKKLSAAACQRNRKLSARRAIVEHPFGVIKHIFNYRKVRYKGILKNSLHQFTLFMLANLYRFRRQPQLLQA